jgi:hypothetical protein
MGLALIPQREPGEGDCLPQLQVDIRIAAWAVAHFDRVAYFVPAAFGCLRRHSPLP